MNAPAQAAGIANECLSAELTDTGALSRIDNLLAGEVYRIQADTFAVVTDRGILSNRDAAPVERDVAPGRARYVFRNGELYDVAIQYTLKPGRRYLERHVTLTNVGVPLTLLNIELGRTVFAAAPGEFVTYDTFWNCPTVSFLRWAKGGLFAGIENPFFRTAYKGNEAAFSFEPALLLKPGDTYESEPQFIGVYRKHGVTIADHYPKTRDGDRPRFRNPCGHLPGKGGYKGWRNATALMRRLTLAFPGSYFQCNGGSSEKASPGRWTTAMRGTRCLMAIGA